MTYFPFQIPPQYCAGSSLGESCLAEVNLTHIYNCAKKTPLLTYVKGASCCTPHRPFSKMVAAAGQWEEEEGIALNHHCSLASCSELAHYTVGDAEHLFRFRETLTDCLVAYVGLPENELRPCDGQTENGPLECACVRLQVSHLQFPLSLPLPLEIRDARTLMFSMSLSSEIFMTGCRLCFFDTCHLYICY